MAWKRICDIKHEDASYKYCANGPAAVVFACLFFVTTTIHVIQALIYHKRFCWVVIMGTAWECLGFTMRAISTPNQTVESTGSTGQLLVILAPLWVNAAVYMIFSRCVLYYLPEQEIGGFKATSVSKIFIWLDICAFIVQATGGLMDGDWSKEISLIGIRIYVGGIALQQVFILGFVILLVKFHLRAERGYADPARNDGWRYLIPSIYAVIALISIRIVYRIIEFALNGESSLSTNEIPFYVLEATPMFLTFVVISLAHPGRFLLGPESEFPRKASRSEKRAAEKAAKERKKAAKEQKKANGSQMQAKRREREGPEGADRQNEVSII